MKPWLTTESLKPITRRYFLEDCWSSLGAIALTSFFNERLFAEAVNPMAPRKPPLSPQKLSVFCFWVCRAAPANWIFSTSNPSLTSFTGSRFRNQSLETSATPLSSRNLRCEAPSGSSKGMANAAWRSRSCCPHTASVADDICLVRSMTTDLFNHAPAELFLFTGSGRPGRPSMGSWVTYGLGSEAKGLPGFVVLHSTSRGWNPGIQAGASCWSSGFLPTTHQGVVLRNSGDPVLNLSDPHGVDLQMQRDCISAINKLNAHRQAVTGDPEIATRVAAFETAYQMQIEAPEITNIGREPPNLFLKCMVPFPDRCPSPITRCLPVVCLKTVCAS